MAIAAQVRLKFIEEEQRLRKTQYETELKVKEQRLKLYKLKNCLLNLPRTVYFLFSFNNDNITKRY